MNTMSARTWVMVSALLSVMVEAQEPINIGTRRELFVDRALMKTKTNMRFVRGVPNDEGIAFSFDRPWEGAFCGYVTMIQDGPKFLAYYRGMPTSGNDGSTTECTCVAESTDGIHWTKPDLDLFDYQGKKPTNIVLAGSAPYSHNFSPFLDTKPGCPTNERFKAVAGIQSSGLHLFVSEDGYRWRKLHEKPFLTTMQVPYEGMFDSQNIAFWSASEGKYLCYFRVFKDNIRRIARTTSDNLVDWTACELMEYESGRGPVSIEQIYTNQTCPYFRAPHIYISCAARFMPGRQVLTDAEARQLGVDPKYYHDASDVVLFSTRGGSRYERELLEGFLRPGIGARNWVSRTNYPAYGILPTGPAEMSIYVNQDYAQPTAHLRRYSLRLDGLMSLRAGHEAGEMLTKPIIFSGSELSVNFSTSASGSLKVEIDDVDGKPIQGFSFKRAIELIGNDLDRRVSWKDGTSVAPLAGKVVRLRLQLRDGDLYSYQFTP